MVKGISRRVVLIKSPDPKIFDEAIFLVREETAKKPGVTYEQILHEAADVAEAFVKNKFSPVRRAALPRWVCAGIGALAVGLLWLATVIF